MNINELIALYDTLTEARALTLSVNATQVLNDLGIDQHKRLSTANHAIGDMLHMLQKKIQLQQDIAHAVMSDRRKTDISGHCEI